MCERCRQNIVFPQKDYGQTRTNICQTWWFCFNIFCNMWYPKNTLRFLPVMSPPVEPVFEHTSMTKYKATTSWPRTRPCRQWDTTPHNTQHRTTRRRHQAATDSDVRYAMRPLVRIGHAGRTVAQTPTSFAPGAWPRTKSKIRVESNFRNHFTFSRRS